MKQHFSRTSFDAVKLEIFESGDIGGAGSDALSEGLGESELKDWKYFGIGDDERVEVLFRLGNHVVEGEYVLTRLHVSRHSHHLHGWMDGKRDE